MEAPLSKFIQLQPSEGYTWHQSSSSGPFKSPDLIELNSDTEKNALAPGGVSYSSSQEEADTEDDGGEVGVAGQPNPCQPNPTLATYELASNDEESCHLLQATEDDSDSSQSEHAWNSCGESDCSRCSSSNAGTLSECEGEGLGPPRHAPSFPPTTAAENYWDMSCEQEQYYTDQFLTLQPDLNQLVTGPVAKGFFEKSKLPLGELREIWQLADVSKDGCLDLAEFKMAMHLVVLRRHGLPIPSHFYARPPEFPAQPIQSSTPKLQTASGGVESQSPLLSSTCAATKSQQTPPKRPSKEWTTFENEPINFSSTCDTSGLVAPVAVRLVTPEEKMLSSVGGSGLKAQPPLQLKAIQRPKHSGHPKVSQGTIAPPPPPRRKTHVRSSSLDLNRLTIKSDCDGGAADGGGESRSFLSPSYQGAFSVYRKEGATPDHTLSQQLQGQLAHLRLENELLGRASAQLLDQLALLQSRRQAIAFKIHQLQGST